MFSFNGSGINYAEDLSPYEEGNLKLQEVLRVGWINKEHTFPTGAVIPEVIDKLKEILVSCNNYPCYVCVHTIRGHSGCPVCNKLAAFRVHDGRTIVSLDNVNAASDGDPRGVSILGCCEIWIPNAKQPNNYFAAHDLIYHYIVDHQYLPPEEFIESVLAFDIHSDFIAEKEYANCVRKYYPEFISVAEMLEQELGFIP
jgi:hypothetical protein